MTPIFRRYATVAVVLCSVFAGACYDSAYAGGSSYQHDQSGGLLSGTSDKGGMQGLSGAVTKYIIGQDKYATEYSIRPIMLNLAKELKNNIGTFQGLYLSGDNEGILEFLEEKISNSLPEGLKTTQGQVNTNTQIIGKALLEVMESGQISDSKVTPEQIAALLTPKVKAIATALGKAPVASGAAPSSSRLEGFAAPDLRAPGRSLLDQLGNEGKEVQIFKPDS
ncbi:MAG: hypothetical protein MRY79_03090 [Alphaproteobacteria bacterium]|nr:hypothetical protein [Alphaproteobacteria bacterium]